MAACGKVLRVCILVATAFAILYAMIAGIYFTFVGGNWVLQSMGVDTVGALQSFVAWSWENPTMDKINRAVRATGMDPGWLGYLLSLPILGLLAWIGNRRRGK